MTLLRLSVGSMTRQMSFWLLLRLSVGSMTRQMSFWISLALKGKKVSMDKVIKMIDDMTVLLKKEQGDDDDKTEM